MPASMLGFLVLLIKQAVATTTKANKSRFVTKCQLFWDKTVSLILILRINLRNAHLDIAARCGTQSNDSELCPIFYEFSNNLETKIKRTKHRFI